jgi:hypothetical protein
MLRRRWRTFSLALLIDFSLWATKIVALFVFTWTGAAIVQRDGAA